MQNIVIIGCVREDYKVDNKLAWWDVLNSINVAELSKDYRNLYFEFLHREFKEIVTREDQTPLLKTFSKAFEYLDKYVNNRFAKVEFNEQEFDEAVAEIDHDEWYYKFLSNKSMTISINSGVTLIQTPIHVCNQNSVLILPFILNQIQHLDNPVLACDKGFIVDCDQEDRYYKISDQFFRDIQRECAEHKIRYIEYIGCWQDICSGDSCGNE